MLKTGMVEAVICVQSNPDHRFSPRPILARTPEEVIAANGVKPTLSPNLNTLALVEAAGVKRLLFCGVGCQVQALRSMEQHLNLEKLYVLGTNCEYLIRFVITSNLLGFPAITVPNGLPIGLQLIGRPRGEASILRLAAAIEVNRITNSIAKNTCRMKWIKVATVRWTS